MKKALICVIIAIMLITAMSINTTTLAVGFKFAMSASATTVKPGNEVTITMAISDIDLGENGMNTLEGVLDYDRNIFEGVKSSDITTQNGWVVTYNDEETGLNGKFLATKTGTGVKENQTLATIKLKVKENVSNQTTTVTIKDIATNDGTNLVEETDKTVSIKIETPSSSSNQGSSEKNNVNTAGNGSASTNTNKATTGSSTSKNKNKNTNKSSLPKTGVDDTIIVVGIVTIVIAGIVSYIRYRQYKMM